MLWYAGFACLEIQWRQGFADMRCQTPITRKGDILFNGVLKVLYLIEFTLILAVRVRYTSRYRKRATTLGRGTSIDNVLLALGQPPLRVQTRLSHHSISGILRFRLSGSPPPSNHRIAPEIPILSRSTSTKHIRITVS